MNNIEKTFKFVAFLAVGLGAAVSSSASPILVSNFSFETLPAGGLSKDTCGVGCNYSSGVAIPGWAGGNTSNGEFRPGTQLGNLTHFSTLSDGITSGYSNGGTISQTVAPTVHLGTTYTLLVDLGKRNDQLFKATADLLINGHTIVATGVAPTSGHWSQFSATYVGLAADVGKSITIQLKSTGGQANFDNVRLSDSTTPEPATAMIFTLGLAGILAYSRRRKRA